LGRDEEQRLIRSAQKGDADAFAALYRANVQRVFRYIFYRVNDTHVAEDLTGDVFMRALEGIGTYQDRGKPFIAWLYTIAHARVVDHYRKTGRRADESDIDSVPLPVNPDMDADLMRRHAAQQLRRAIATLTVDQQQVIILRFIERQSINQVAGIMGKRPNAIKALQHRALRSLASRLERSGVNVEEILSGLS
jgi:RNA polymerase sigma-70 factor (ECF subfamily)